VFAAVLRASLALPSEGLRRGLGLSPSLHPVAVGLVAPEARTQKLADRFWIGALRVQEPELRASNEAVALLLIREHQRVAEHPPGVVREGIETWVV